MVQRGNSTVAEVEDPSSSVPEDVDAVASLRGEQPKIFKLVCKKKKLKMYKTAKLICLSVSFCHFFYAQKFNLLDLTILILLFI